MKSLVVIYRFKDYKTYLSAVEEEFNRFDRGFRSRLAEALGVQNAFVSKVLNQPKVHFSIEQAMSATQALELDKDESAYLIWLVESARAGTKELKEFFLNLIELAQNRYLNIKNRVGSASAPSEQDQNRFYSHWLYGAAHVMSSIPQFTSIAKMAEALRVDQKALREVLIFLSQIGLVTAKDDLFLIGPTQLHLSKSSPHISKHHTNWRLKAIDDVSDPASGGIHYSTVSSLSHKDVEKLKHDLTEVIQDYVEVIKASPEETACCFNLDFFRLIK